MNFRLSKYASWLIINVLPLGCGSNEGKQQVELFSPKGVEDISVNTLEKGDTGTVRQLIQNGIEANAKSPNKDSAIAYYTKALDLSTQIGFWEAAAIAANNLSAYYTARQEFVRANYYRTQFTVTRGRIPSRFYDTSKTIHRYLLCYGDFEKAQGYYNATRFDSATHLYIKVIEQLEPADLVSKRTLASAYSALGAMYDHVSDSGRAMHYFDRTLSVAHQFGDTDLLLLGLYNKSNSLVNNNNLEQGLALAKEVLAIAQSVGNVQYEGQGAYQIAHCLIKQGRSDSALAYSTRSLQSAIKIGSERLLISSYYLLGFNYNKLKQYNKAERYLLAGIQSAQKLKSYTGIYGAYAQLASTYEHIGNYKQALYYNKLYITKKDSLRGAENAARISEIETRYQVAKKDKQLTRQQLKIAYQEKNLYLWLGGALLLVGLLIGLLRRNRHKAVVAQLTAKLAGEEQERARMAKELHDGIVSQLSVIKTHFSALPVYTRDNSEAGALQDAVQQLDQSIAELRSTAHNLLPDGLLRDGLLQSLNNYCDKLSRGGTLEVSFQVVGKLPPLSDEFQLNCYRIIQELLQNIHKHSGADRALVQFNIQKDVLEITVEDNGLPGAQPAPGVAGIGLKNLKERVKLLEGRMEIEKGQGTSVYLNFDLIKHTRTG